MKSWKIHEAKAKFSELLKAGVKSPQLIVNREKKVGVLISYEQFLQFQQLLAEHKKPTIADYLQTLKELQVPDEDFPEIERKDRKDWVD
jgi:prevent-host-death family protein